MSNTAIIMSEVPVSETKEVLPEKTTDKTGKKSADKIKELPEEVPAKNTEPGNTTIKDSRPAEKEKETKIISADESASLVLIKSNDYDAGSFGGIKNLELTVTNTSKYTLDHVRVELRYLKPRDEFLKAETISFRSVPPDGSQTVAVNKSNRGVKVTFKVISVQSKAISGNTAGL